jgi:hypothetical protein
MFIKNLLTKGFTLTKRHNLKSPGPFKSEAQAAYTGKQFQQAEFIH